MDITEEYFPKLQDITRAQININEVSLHTPLQYNLNLSEKYGADIYLKREDLQVVRSYKIRGAYNKISGLPPHETSRGIVCASAGNHAQGVAYACNRLDIHGKIFMPATTPRQKIRQVEMFGKDKIEVILIGDTYDASETAAREVCRKENMIFIHPFDDRQIIEGQATIGMEILQDTKQPVDFLFLPVGGGGLAAGTGAYFNQISPHTKLIGVEPEGAPSMKRSIEAGKIVELDNIDRFVDGAAVKKVGKLSFNICRKVIDQLVTIPEGKVCTQILDMYNQDAIVMEPAGALSVAALDLFSAEIKNKTVVCIISGSNNDITRLEEIKERSLLYEGLKHYFIVRFPQRAGALRLFVDQVLGSNDDITYFEYSKKTSRERGPAVIGIEVSKKEDFRNLTERMKKHGFEYEYLNDEPSLFQVLI